MSKRAFKFSLSINREEYLKYYAGYAAAVRTETLEGPVIEFPASALKPWVTHSGLEGTFEIHFDNNNKLVNIERIG